MRVPFAAVVVMSVALTPAAGQANPITPESMPPATSGTASDGAIGSSALFDESDDPILVVTSFGAFDPGSHGKLRGGPGGGGIVFVPIGGPSGGNSWSFGGPWGGNPGGGASSGPPGPGSFTLLSFVTPDPDLNLGLGPGFGPGPDFGFGSSQSFSFEQCCNDETPTVPEPSAMLLAASGLLLGLKRVMRSRSAAATTRS